MKAPIKTVCILILFGICINVSAQIQLLNDEFNHAATLSANWLNINDVEGWNAEHLEVHDINTSSLDELYMMPYTSSWYQDWRGTLIHKNINQNFVITTEVTALNRAQNGLPNSQFSLAGIMLRIPRDFPNGALQDWVAGGENYIFLATGYANSGVGPHFEVKNTVNSNSQLGITSIPTSTDVQIRVARIDEAIIILYRLPNQQWQVHQRYSRPDFPSEIQVGFVTYTDWPKVSSYDPFFQNSNVINPSLNPDPTSGVAFNPDLIGTFDFARFDDVDVPQSLENTDLVNHASDMELLSFLNYGSDSFCPQDVHVFSEINQNQIASMQVQNMLTADNAIAENAIVNYTAQGNIELLADFEVYLGAEFIAEIQACN